MFNRPKYRIVTCPDYAGRVKYGCQKRFFLFFWIETCETTCYSLEQAVSWMEGDIRRDSFKQKVVKEYK